MPAHRRRAADSGRSRRVLVVQLRILHPDRPAPRRISLRRPQPTLRQGYFIYDVPPQNFLSISTAPLLHLESKDVISVNHNRCLFRGHAVRHDVCLAIERNFRIFQKSYHAGWLTRHANRPDAAGNGFFPAITGDTSSLKHFAKFTFLLKRVLFRPFQSAQSAP